MVGIGLMVIGTIASVKFEQNCKGLLKRAADANTVELAAQELEKAVGYLETNGLTTGDTSVFYSTPKCELDFWYSNLRTALDELNEFPENSDQLTISSHLLKLRESIMDQGEKGSRVTIPPNTHLYPRHKEFRMASAMTLAGLVGGFLLLAIASEKKCKSSSTESAAGDC